mgnify:CR=1 FL=1
MTIKINRLEFENIKKIRAVSLEPSKNGLTVIGGKNAQGKTTVLDAIAWTLGGNKFKPSEPKRNGSMVAPILKVELSNGLIVERTGKNSDLKITDPSGEKAGQKLLDSFISELALDLPKFLNSSNKDKARTLLEVIGVEKELAELELKENELYHERRSIGKIKEQKKNIADGMDYFPEVEDSDPLSVSDLIERQQRILVKNNENRKQRLELEEMRKDYSRANDDLDDLKKKIEELQAIYSSKKDDLDSLAKNISAKAEVVSGLKDESTLELENSIANVEELNNKIATNINKSEALKEAEELENQYNSISNELEETRQKKFELLENADLPLPDLSVIDGELAYKDSKWDCMSGMERLKVATAIVRRLQPDCGFVLVDELEKFDEEELIIFGKWAEDEGLQIIATRVSSGEECSIIISDGYIEENNEEVNWKNIEWK